MLIHDRKYQSLAEDARDASSPNRTLKLMTLPESIGSRDLDNEATVSNRSGDSPTPKFRSVSEHDIAYLHHTSGTSTGLPKPIPQSHHAAVGVLPTMDKDYVKATFTTTPLYHGGVADCFRAWTSGALIWLFPGREVPITATNILKSLECTRRAETITKTPAVQYFSSVPYVLQMMAADTEGILILKKMETVGVGGAALPPSVGDGLVRQGMNLVSRFGSAECGFLMSSHRQYMVDKEWQFLRSHESPHLSFEPRENGLAELVIRPSWPHMAKRNREDGSYATADLFEKHPTIPCAWRYHSRADSQLTLATGKKFDPAPFEAAIATSPLLTEALIFGNGEQHPGALLFRSRESADWTNDSVLQAVWPNIEKFNSESQSHARLLRNMLVVMPKNAPGLEKSSKGTPLRGPAETRYAAEIDKAYEGGLDDAVGATQNGDHPKAITNEAVPTTVLEIVKEVFGDKDSIPESADLFSYGVDSIACMRIRALLQSRILATKDVRLPLNVVYDCGTIKRISHYLLTVRQGGKPEYEDEILQMNAYVSQYGIFNNSSNALALANTHPDSGIKNGGKGEVVILTGATGTLGAHILAQLRSSSQVSEIHCLVRAASLTAANERVSKSLLARNKAPLDGHSNSKVSCHPCKLSEPNLGLSYPFKTVNGQNTDLYTYLSHHATIIIHVAWAVNFSTRLSSFVKDHIAGLQNVLNFALASPNTLPPRFLFCSSTASVLGLKAESPIPERISHEPLSASPLGYSRSKWVAERICEQAHINTRLRDRISILRIGQLCGDTKSGIWNVTEAWPIMLSSIGVINCLPDLKEFLDWLPVDVAAEAVIESALSDIRDITPNRDSPNIPVLHILNPNTQTTWSDLLHWLQKLYPDFDILPPAEWVQRLEELKGDAAKHPAKKLLGLWKDAYVTNGNDVGDEDADGKNEKTFEMEQTKRAVSVLRDVRPIGEEQFEKIWAWIEKEMM